MDHANKIQELEGVIEKERMTYHETKLEIAELEEKIQNLKHENLLLTSKIEEMNFNEIELNEKIKKLQESYESQVEDLTASRQETRSKWKDKYKGVSQELEMASERMRSLEMQLDEQEKNMINEENQHMQTKTELENSLTNAQEQIQELREKVDQLEADLKSKNKMIQHQKGMINKLANEKDDIGLDFEKQEKLFEVSINEKNNKIDHLQIMINKYKKVIDKADEKLKQLPQEFALEMVSMKKKLKREKDGISMSNKHPYSFYSTGN